MGKTVSTPEIQDNNPYRGRPLYNKVENAEQLDEIISEEEGNEFPVEVNTKDINLLIGCSNGPLYEYSLRQEKIIREFDKLKNQPFYRSRGVEVKSIVMADKKRTFFVQNVNNDLYEFSRHFNVCEKKL